MTCETSIGPRMSDQATILVVEDEASIRDLLVFHLECAGLRVRAAEDASSGWASLVGVDAVVLDWMLPDASGLAWLRRLRVSEYAALPVLMLTARASEFDRVEGLESGADDYLVKPFSTAELVARVRALLRRVRPHARVTVGSLVIDVAAASVTLDEVPVRLTRREYDLLLFLASYPGRVFSRSDLLDRVWGTDFVGTERTVDQHVAQLRALLGPQRIQTVRGRGYRLSDG
jgi:DNA-binding response OmpR family regulator